MTADQIKAMEGPLIALANSAGGDLRKLLYAFFSFLHRRTDFYLVPNDVDLKEGKVRMGFPEGEAEKLLLAAFRQFPLRRMPRQQQQQSKQQPTTQPKKAEPKTESAPSPKEQQSTTPASSKDVEKDAKNTTTEDEKKPEKKEPEETVRYTEEGLQVPVGNGGSTKRYKWTQTLEECTVLIGLPEGTRAKDLDVSMKVSSIHVKTKVKSGEATVFVEGPLAQKVQPDECTWSLEGGVMLMVLHKMKKTFWDTIIDGDDKIDTSLVDSRRHISDYDEATQGQLRRIMFDQKQQEKGLPTSDDITGTKTIPSMPPGVEYIDQKKMDEVQNKK
ncbi:Nuclear migration protein nudC [Seminavis robusta]|uniref:Nuclear migration protein nudC n=1 Tax=Seminavis robusta TaxID=568900 RepID=A0A9N8HP03_9STRA|nr:Nuclear migration protein nudC [Seminavis robusta]|eukprot:Sro864_g212660.1 Nuclear migration protein nudC (330) ;mRNA; f:29986-30975